MYRSNYLLLCISLIGMAFGTPGQQLPIVEPSSSSEEKKYVRKCCVPGCHSTAADFNLFKFPTTSVKREWYNSLKNGFNLETVHDVFLKLRINKYNLLCELHFTSDCFSENCMTASRVCLKRSAIPSIFDATEVKISALAGNSGVPGRVYNLDDDTGSVGLVRTIGTDSVSVPAPLAPLIGMQVRSEHSYAKKEVSALEPEVLLTSNLEDPEELPLNDNDVPGESTICSDQQDELTLDPKDESWRASESLLNESCSSDDNMHSGREKQPMFFQKASELLSSVSQKFFMVEVKKLLELFPSHCNCLSDISFNVDTAYGSGIVVHAQCSEKKSAGCYERTWSSQSKINNMWLGDLLLSSAILCVGCSPSKIIRLFHFMQMPVYSIQTFIAQQWKYVAPGIIKVWRKHQADLIDRLKAASRRLELSGDGSCDSIGRSAMYCRYVMFENFLGRIIDIQLVKKSMVGGHSPNMERLGLQNSIEFLARKNGMPIESIVTDRHRSIRAWLRDNHPNIKHYYDIWHVSKGLKKKLLAVSLRSGCEQVKKWIRAATNHLYWVAQKGKNAAVRVAMWCSLANHVVDQHFHESPEYPSCQHEEDHEAKIDYMLAGSKAAFEFEKVVNDRNLIDDVQRLSPEHQTYFVESFNALVTHYAPKNLFYGWVSHAARIMVAALHFNYNADREQATTRDDTPRWGIRYAKHRNNEPFVQPVKTAADYGYFTTLREAILEAVKEDPGGKIAKQLRLAAPPEVSRLAVDKDSLITGHVTRFATSGEAPPARGYQPPGPRPSLARRRTNKLSDSDSDLGEGTAASSTPAARIRGTRLKSRMAKRGRKLW